MKLYSKFVKYVSYPLIRRREGIREIYSNLRKFEETQYWPLDRLVRLQWRRLQRLLIHANENTHFYRSTFKSAGFDPNSIEAPDELLQVPILTKSAICENLQGMLAHNYAQTELHSSETGGTTGVKIKFYRDNYCLSPKEAATIRHERWTGWDVGERVGLVWPARQDYVGAHTWKAKARNSLSDRYITLPAAVLTDDDIQKYCLKLKRLHPTKIRCFPYSLYLVARFILENNIQHIQPKGIITTGEPLYDHQRNCIEAAFTSKVFDSYGSRETGLIAQECEYHKAMHVNMESVYLEFIGDDGTPVKPGKTGRIIVTDLLNYGMPLIRYDLGDFGVSMTGKCPCGRALPLMKGIQGRVADRIIVPSGRDVSSITLVLYLVDNGPRVGQVQILQDAIDHLTIRMTNNPEPDNKTFNYYRSTIENLLGHEMRITFDIVQAIPRESSGKYRFVKSLLHSQHSQK
jgi:phenylacetate-CoA ligase